jgi:hypothetical protein
MEVNLLDVLPYELLYVFQIYLGNDKSLGMSLYEDYLHNIHQGYEFVFDIISNDDRYPTYRKEVLDFQKVIKEVSFSITSSRYFDTMSNITDLSFTASLDHASELLKLNLTLALYFYRLTYIDHLNRNSKIVNILITINNGNFVLDMSSYHQTIRPNREVIKSENKIENSKWKNIWDALDLYHKNAILYQNGFPIIG